MASSKKLYVTNSSGDKDEVLVQVYYPHKHHWLNLNDAERPFVHETFLTILSQEPEVDYIEWSMQERLYRVIYKDQTYIKGRG